VPPDYEPGTFPRPKAEDESESIESWLEVTQQPIRDWEWDGNHLRLIMLDGSVETYTRDQLSEFGVFDSGESQAFAESQDDDDDDAGQAEAEEDDTEDEEGAAESPFGDEGESLDSCPCPAGAPSGPDSTIQSILGGEDTQVITGEPAERLASAVSDVVSAIIGLVTGDSPPAGDPTGDSACGAASGELDLAASDQRPDEDYDQGQLAQGVEVEQEHTQDMDEAKKIAKDHLDEDPRYYTKLNQMEG
jgi:hypothetical protein